MTDQAAVYRPSPRPRPAGAPSRPVDGHRLHVVPPPADPQVSDSEVPTSGISGDSAGATPESITAGQSGSAVTVTRPGFRVRVAGTWAASRTYWTPPAVFTDRPASLHDLAAYAKQAPWTAQQTGLIRAFGVGYYRYGAYPYTVVSRYREWFVQRPLRYAALLGGVKLAALTGPGHWVVHTVVYPAAQFAGHIFL